VQFNTYLFGCFFALVLAIHHAPISWTARKVSLLVASYVFYAAWDPVFVVLWARRWSTGSSPRRWCAT
jgi:alginate O-acetyltransferase complex protein AlgI